MNTKKDFNGALMARDMLGRDVADERSAPKARPDRLVGMFYFLWLGEHGRHKPYDVSKIMEAHAGDGTDVNSYSEWGSVGTYHHWGEPLFGYYYSDDEWVIRRHMKLIIEADIDFLYLDVTNAVTYDKNVMKVLRVLDEYRREGWRIPLVMFYTNSASGATVEHLYQNIYKKNVYPETWFYMDGKPVIIAHADECSEEAREFFNIQVAQWPNEPDRVGGWPWMDFTRPQRVFCDADGSPKTISVSVAQHPQLRFGDSVLYGETTNCGRAYHDGRNDPAPDAYKYGYNFAEQFDRAIEADPPIVLVTGWNEWIAGRWQGIPERPIMFVDCANYEYSRDVEMMRGGYFDSYFMQLVDYVRKYKGVSDRRSYGVGEIATYHNFSDGDFERSNEGYGQRYENHTQRNAIVRVDVKDTGSDLVFDIYTKDKLICDMCGTWMKIYLNTSGGIDYDYVINNTPDGNGHTTVARISDGFAAEDIAKAEYKVFDDHLRVSVRKSDISLESGYRILFKVADSKESINSFEDMYVLGDVAPTGRLNYVYESEK